MSEAVSQRIDELLAKAESKGSCLATKDKALVRALRRRVKKGQLVEPATGVFARTESWNELKRIPRARWLIRGLAQLHPSWIFCGPSAGLVQGLEVSEAQVEKVHIADRFRAKDCSSRWLARHECCGSEFVEIDGIRVTPFLQTVHDCLRVSGFRRGLAIADSALKVSGMDRFQLAEAFRKKFQRYPDLLRELAIIAYADARSDNGGESMARGTMIMEGFPLPLLQVEMTDPITGQTYRADYDWPGANGMPNFGELDGGGKYDDPTIMGGRTTTEVMRDERRRESRMTSYRAQIIRFSFEEAVSPHKLARILTAFGIPQGPQPALERGVPVREDLVSNLVIVDERILWFGDRLVHAEQCHLPA